MAARLRDQLGIAQSANRNLLRLVLGVATLAAVAIYTISYRVHEGDVIIVTRLGEPVRVTESAGLHFKFPWPVAAAIPINVRYRILTTPQTELLTRDKKNIVLMTSATWRVVDPILFHRSVRTTRNADDKLQGLVINANIATFGQYDLAALVSTDPTTLNIEGIERDVLRAVNLVAASRYGIEAETLGFRRVSLPSQNIPFVLEQMRAERRQFAAQFRAEGALSAAQIRSKADIEAARLIAEAKEKAIRLRGNAEAKAAKIYAEAHATAPEFYRFLRSMESLKHIVGENANLTLRTDVAPFNLLKYSPEASGQELPDIGQTTQKLTELSGTEK